MNIPHVLILTSVEQQNVNGHIEHLRLHTDSGAIPARLHKAPDTEKAVVWVGGVGGGLDGPAEGLYPRLAEELLKENISSLCVDYRLPVELSECILDIIVAIGYLKNTGYKKIVLVGHSSGGAAVITAGAIDDNVIGVAAISSQTYGTDLADQLSPKPLLLIHGTNDEILPDSCSMDIYQKANEPKEILLYPDCGHVLNECRQTLDEDLGEWILEVFTWENR